MATYNDLRKAQDKITELERRLLAVETTSRLESASVGSGGVNIYEGGAVNMKNGGKLEVASNGKINVHGGSLHIRGTGEMIVDGNAEFRNATNLKGNTSFGGNLNITSGSLSLPNGSIASDALAEQLEVKYSRTSKSNFGLGTSYATIVSTSMSCPSWATRAAVIMKGFMIAEYTGGGFTAADISGHCAGSTSPSVATTLYYNEVATRGNMGEVVWSNTLNSVGKSITSYVRSKARVAGEMRKSTKSWAEVEMVAFFMR